MLDLENSGKISVIRAYEDLTFGKTVDATSITPINKFEKILRTRTIEHDSSRKNRKNRMKSITYFMTTSLSL